MVVVVVVGCSRVQKVGRVGSGRMDGRQTTHLVGLELPGSAISRSSSCCWACLLVLVLGLESVLGVLALCATAEAFSVGLRVLRESRRRASGGQPTFSLLISLPAPESRSNAESAWRLSTASCCPRGALPTQPQKKKGEKTLGSRL